jgi:hypothetical protein
MQDDEPGFNAGEVMDGPMMEDRGGMNGPTMEDPERWRILIAAIRKKADSRIVFFRHFKVSG